MSPAAVIGTLFACCHWSGGRNILIFRRSPSCPRLVFGIVYSIVVRSVRICAGDLPLHGPPVSVIVETAGWLCRPSMPSCASPYSQRKCVNSARARWQASCLLRSTSKSGLPLARASAALRISMKLTSMATSAGTMRPVLAWAIGPATTGMSTVL